jgi:uncharacterized protein
MTSGKAMTADVPLDCRQCGVCCFSPAPAYVRVTGEDWSRLGERAEELAYFVGNRAFMRMQAGHCSALQVQRGADGQAEFFCTIYEQRPQTCRDLDRGSPECAGERATKGARMRLDRKVA